MALLWPPVFLALSLQAGPVVSVSVPQGDGGGNKGYAFLEYNDVVSLGCHPLSEWETVPGDAANRGEHRALTQAWVAGDCHLCAQAI